MAQFGFVGRRRPPRDDLPPGQYDVGADWPVLTAEVTPRVDPQRWTMTVDGLVEHPQTWSWDDLHALPESEYQGPIHCVTTWSKFDTRFAGVSVDLLLDAAAPTSAAARPGWCVASTASRCPATTVDRCGCWCRTCTSGSRPSGSPS